MIVSTSSSCQDTKWAEEVGLLRSSCPSPLLGMSLSSLTTEGCDEEERLTALKFALFVLFTVAVTPWLVAILIITKFRGSCFLCYQTVQGLVFEDDAYPCFGSKDFEWVQNAWLAQLDAQYSAQNRLCLCLEERLHAGQDVLANIHDAVWSSRKVVRLVSRHFLRDGWCLADLSSALIVVVVGSLSRFQLMKHESLRALVQKQQYLRWPEDRQDVGWFLKLSQHILQKEEEKDAGKDDDIPLQTQHELQMERRSRSSQLPPEVPALHRCPVGLSITVLSCCINRKVFPSRGKDALR